MVFSSLDTGFDDQCVDFDSWVLGCVNFGRRDGFLALWMQVSMVGSSTLTSQMYKNFAARLCIYCKIEVSTLNDAGLVLQIFRSVSFVYHVHLNERKNVQTNDQLISFVLDDGLKPNFGLCNRYKAIPFQDETVDESTLISNSGSSDFGCINFDQFLEYLDVKNLVI
ncbi:unnamed protein product [Rhizophagus irregularis]|nr:unnamed protein product [Rhizophagus irregularis]